MRCTVSSVQFAVFRDQWLVGSRREVGSRELVVGGVLRQAQDFSSELEVGSVQFAVCNGKK